MSDRYFQVLGVPPSVGRAFTASEDSTPGGDAVVILSDGLSKRVFGSAAQAVTRALVINGQSFRVVGVAPAGFTGTTLGFVADLWIPSELETRIRPAATLRNRGMRGWFGMARLTPHATIDQARSALGMLAERLERERPDSNTGVGFTALRESDGRIFPMLRGSVVGLSAVTITVSLLVLIIACGYRPPDGEGWPSTELARIDTDYFRTLKLPLVEGREFTDTDRLQSRPVVIVNEFVARQYWPGVRSVVGKYVTTPEGERFEVVGVARLSKYFSIGEDPRPYVYFPLRQGGARTTTIVARTSSNDAEYLRRMVAAIRDLDPLVPVYDVTTMRSRVATSLAPTTGGAAALSVVGVLALILTSLGLYGIIAQTVSGRTYEIGVRRALGARDGDVITLVVRDALVMVIAGVACGLAAAVAGAPLLRAVLYDVNPADPVVFGTAPGVLLAVSAAAAFVPAWRAIRINAATALRHD